MKLAFKRRFGFGYYEKEIPVTFNIGVLERACKALDIELYDIGTALRRDDYDFLTRLLFEAYTESCRERYQRPKYNFCNAVIWKEHISQTSLKEFMDQLEELFGSLTNSAEEGKKKVMRERPV